MKKLISLIIILVLVGVDINLFKDSFYDDQKLKEVSANDGKLSDLKAENDSLKKSLQEKGSGFFIEKEARDKLGLEKSGETTIVIAEGRLEPENKEKKTQEKTNPQKWFYLLTN